MVKYSLFKEAKWEILEAVSEPGQYLRPGVCIRWCDCEAQQYPAFSNGDVIWAITDHNPMSSFDEWRNYIRYEIVDWLRYNKVAIVWED